VLVCGVAFQLARIGPARKRGHPIRAADFFGNVSDSYLYFTFSQFIDDKVKTIKVFVADNKSLRA
jgi:hypothetical protein